MFKLLSIVLATTAVGAFAATTAYAGGCCSTASPSCGAAAPSCCTTTAPAASGDMQNMPGMTQAPAAPNAARTYSYEPSMRANSSTSARSQAPLYLVPKTQR